VLESAILDSTTGQLHPANLVLHPPSAATTESDPAPSPTAQEAPANLTLDAVIHQHIQLVLRLNRGNKLRAAKQLGISRSTLYRLLGGESFMPGTAAKPETPNASTNGFPSA
jgi:DNA-binding NtrC family response regulator